MKGHITKHVAKDGTVTWRAVVDMPPDPETGRRRQKRLSGLPTKKAAEAATAQFIASIENNTFGEADAQKLTTREYLRRWLASIQPTVRPSTFNRYDRALAHHVEPFIGRIRLSKLTPLDVQRLYANRLESGLSPTTVQLLHNVLHRAMKQAVRWRLVHQNVTEAADAPHATMPDYVAWDADQAAKFLAAADKDDLAALWRLALLTGMRRGEILGLRWEDLDLARARLSVKRTLISGATGALEPGLPKTQAGRRQVDLPPLVVESLQHHRLRQLEGRLQMGTAYTDNGLVFADEVGVAIHPSTLRRRFIDLIKAAGVPAIRFHDLRHTSATLMLANGENPKIVKERLGHSSVTITLDRYSHVTPTMQQDAANRLEKLIAGRG